MCEEEIKKATASVFKYILPKSWSKERKEKDPITAERVVEAIKAGKDVEIINAVIEGPFILKSVNVEGEVTIQRTTIRDPIDWSYATFKRVLNLENSIFEFETDATFTAVTVDKDIFLDEATFCGKAVFTDITVMGAFYSRSTTFKKDVIFSDGIVKKRIAFSKSTFVGDAYFGRARIGSAAEFTGATFKQQAIFNRTQIEGAAEFNGAMFKKQAIFNSAQIKDSAFFNPAYLFSWDSVPGDDDKKLKKFLRDDFDIGWAENSEILKSDDGETISIFKYGKSAEIIIDEKKEKATLKITDGRIHELKVKKENGKLNIYNPATFVGEADFGSARIGSTAMFRRAVFKQQASFNGAQIEGVAFFNPATFVGEANFVSARIGGTADFTGAEFKQLAIFSRAQIEESAFFNPATFKGEANFGSARIGSNAEFTEAVFKKKAIFNGARIEGSAFFNPATFEGKADFISARIGSTADFTGAEFMKKAIFNGAQIEESAFFNPATFVGDADFISARIGSTADFTGAEFKQLAIFSRAQIEESAFFNPATFVGEANFGSARIGSNAVFTGAKFEQQAYFDSAQIERESHFEGTVFVNNVSFQDTSFKTVFFGEPNVKFIKNIDLRGCTYDRIQPIPFWKQLMAHLGPYDRRPFTQLEETFRRAGKDELADDVYYKGKCREYTENIAIRKPIGWAAWLHSALRKHGSWRALLYSALRKLSALLLDRFLFYFTGYGVRLYRLLLAIVPILMLGTYIFQREGAVTPELDSALPWSEAFWVSLNTFLPVIEIPSGADWKPSSQIIPILSVLNIKFTTLATLLVLAGWILVPVAVAGIAGLLKRSK